MLCIIFKPSMGIANSSMLMASGSMSINPNSVNLPPRYPTQLEQQQPVTNTSVVQQYPNPGQTGVVQHQNGPGPIMSGPNSGPHQMVPNSLSQMSPGSVVTSAGTGPPQGGAPYSDNPEVISVSPLKKRRLDSSVSGKYCQLIDLITSY